MLLTLGSQNSGLGGRADKVVNLRGCGFQENKGLK